MVALGIPVLMCLVSEVIMCFILPDLRLFRRQQILR